MRLVTQKDAGLSTYLGIIEKSGAGIYNSSLKQVLINTHTDANKGVIRGHLPLEYIFGFCKLSKNITEGFGFELVLRATNRKRDILYTTSGDEDVNVTVNNISLFIPQIIPSPEPQVYFNEPISESFTLSYESWTTDRKPIDAAKEFQIDFSSASNSNSPIHLIAAHQLTQWPDPTDPTINLSTRRFNNAIFDHAKVRKYYVEIDGIRYPKKPIKNNYAEINYLDQYRDIKLFYKKHVGKPVLYPIISYGKMKK